MSVDALLPVMDALILLEPGGRGQFRIEEVKGILGRCRRSIAVLNLVELGRELLVVVNVLLAMVLPLNGVGDPLIALEA